MHKELHIKFHSQFGFGNNTLEQFEKWIRDYGFSYQDLNEEFIISSRMFFIDFKNVCKQFGFIVKTTENSIIFGKQDKNLKIYLDKETILKFRKIFSDKKTRQEYIEILRTISETI